MSRAAPAIVMALVIAVAVAYVSATHRVFSATADEPQHIAAGLDWLSGHYDFWREQELQHVAANPPLARVAVAVGPYLGGLRVASLRDLLYLGPGYAANLVRARLGVLPFLVLALALTFLAGKRLFGAAAGVAAAAALACVPAFLGHAGLATTDVALSAMFLLALLALLRWLATPTATNAALLGLALGLSLATKLSTLAVAPAAAVLVLAHRGNLEASPGPAPARRLAGQLALAGGTVALVLWAVYRFSVGVPSAVAGGHLYPRLLEGCLGTGLARRVVGGALERSLPAPELWDGLLSLCAQDESRHSTSYLFGRISQSGFPLFFPVALAVKTPLPFLALAAAGVVAAARAPADSRKRTLAPALVALTVLVCAMPSRINVGVRHVLHVYPLLAVYAGAGAVALWRAVRRRAGARVLAVVLGAWLLSTPARAAPDHMAWFNALAGQHPEDVLLDSDLDWGQDLLRLERELAERHVPAVAVAYFGPGDLCRHRLPRGRWLRPYERAHGWIAVSEMYRKGVVGFYYRDGDYCDRSSLVREAKPDPGQYAWLDAETPVARVGRSILLYDVP